jgi:hypothetical protein
LPSKLWEVVTSYFPRILQPGASAGDQTRNDQSTDIRFKSLGSDEPREAVEERGVEVRANATSEDEGAAYRLLRTLSAPTMDASKAILKRNRLY